uniref:Uncharacterized protein n=1 Tax=Zooxanthella nutricula TaxID=1333877 RepID=A0A7S2K9U7_9DINO
MSPPGCAAIALAAGALLAAAPASGFADSLRAVRSVEDGCGEDRTCCTYQIMDVVNVCLRDDHAHYNTNPCPDTSSQLSLYPGDLMRLQKNIGGLYDAKSLGQDVWCEKDVQRVVLAEKNHHFYGLIEMLTYDPVKRPAFDDNLNDSD